jgi:hypothetical protein
MDFILKLLALAVFVVGTTQAQTLTLQSQTQHIDFHDHVEFLEDPNGSLSISNLHQPEVEARFRRWTDASSQISLGYSSSMWWFRIRLKTGPLRLKLRLACFMAQSCPVGLTPFTYT